MDKSNKNLSQDELEDLLEHVMDRLVDRACNSSRRHTLEWALGAEKYLEDVLRFVAPHGGCTNIGRGLQPGAGQYQHDSADANVRDARQ